MSKTTNTALQKIIAGAYHLFKKYGIRSVTMDDIARELGVSKKTLYQHINNKADLVKQTVAFLLQHECEKVHEIYENTKNAIEEKVAISDFVTQHLNMLNPNVIYELKKYYPETWELIEKHRTEFVYNVLVDNIQRGVEQGLYRKNIHPQVIALSYIAQMEQFLNGAYFRKNKLKPVEVYNELFKYHLFGIASAKGMAFLKENMEKFKKQRYVYL